MTPELHTVKFCTWAGRDLVVGNYQAIGWEVERMVNSAGDRAQTLVFRRQRRGPLGRFRRNRYLVLVVLP